MESDKSSVSPTKDPDIQKQRAILSNLLAKLNITGYESKSLLPEPGQRKKIQPNLTEKRVRRASSHSILPKDEKALSEDAPKSADDFLLKPKTLQKEGHISLDSGIEEKKKMPIKPFAKGSVPQGQRFFDAGTEKKPSGNFPELIGAKSVFFSVGIIKINRLILKKIRKKNSKKNGLEIKYSLMRLFLYHLRKQKVKKLI